MFPVLTPNYMADLDLRNTIFRSQINLPVFPGGVLGADLFNVRLLELARINLFALYLASLRITICRIYYHGAKKKMARIYTGRVVASVAYKYVFRWEVAVCNGIRNAMGLVSHAFNLEASITLIPFMARPYPAGIHPSGPINHLPKSINYIFIKHGETPKYNTPLAVSESRQRPDNKGRVRIVFDCLSLARLIRIIAHKFGGIKSAIVQVFAPGERPALVREKLNCSY